MPETNGSTFSRLAGSSWSPARIGAVALRNRMVMAPMVTLFPEEVDLPTVRHVDFYAERARGGAGLVIVGATYVSRAGKGFPNQMGIDEDAKIPFFQELLKD